MINNYLKNREIYIIIILNEIIYTAVIRKPTMAIKYVYGFFKYELREIFTNKI